MVRPVAVYQIYPRSFQDSNNDGIGDLKGIIQRLDYLKGGQDSLGVDAIWISPFYPSPMKDFGYDISDYRSVDPIFGTLKDFERLVEEAHKRELKVLIDFVPNHTSDQHPWFQSSRSSITDPKRDWYIWRDPRHDGSPPNNWLSVFGGSAWQFDEKTGQYYLHSFLKEQPDLNWRNPLVRSELQNTVRFWMEKGVDGLRIDAISFAVKDALFRDDDINKAFIQGGDPFFRLLHKRSYHQPDLFKYLKEIEEVLAKEFPGTFMITEAYPLVRELDSIPFYVSYYTNLEPIMSAPFNFETIFLPWDAKRYENFIETYLKALPPNSTPIFVLGNHDQSRIATRIGEKQARVAAMLLLTLPGLPFIYYGDEIGMTDTQIPPDKVQDPFERNVPGLGLGRDPQRTPMQWSGKTHSGFSESEPWLPVNKNYSTVNVNSEKKAERSMFTLYKKLLKLRRDLASLYDGDYRPSKLGNESVYIFSRLKGQEKVIVALNFSTSEQKVNLSHAHTEVILNTFVDNETQITNNLLMLRPCEGVILKTYRP